MRDAELKNAEAMVERLKSGDDQVLPDLNRSCQRKVLELTHDLFIGLKQEDSRLARRLIIETYNQLMEDGSLSFEDRDSFYGMAALAVRRILVDIIRRLEQMEQGPSQQRIMETFRTYVRSLG